MLVLIPRCDVLQPGNDDDPQVSNYLCCEWQHVMDIFATGKHGLLSRDLADSNNNRTQEIPISRLGT